MILRTAATVAVLAVTAGCASMTGYQVAFHGEQTGYRTENTPSIYVLPNSPSMERTLDIESRRMVESALKQMGYTLTTDAKADVFLMVEAWMEKKESRTMASVIRPQSVTYVRDNNGTTRTVRMPERALSFPVSVKSEYPRMAMVAVDAKQFRSGSDAAIVWRGDTVLPREGIVINQAVPYLLYPLVSSFGTQSKGVIKVEVSSQQAMGFK